MTKKEMFNTIAEIIVNTDVENKTEIVDFCNHEIELLSRKHSSSKPSAKQIENENIKNEIVEILEQDGGMMTISEIQKANEELSKYTNQKMSALISQLRNENRIKREYIKKVAYFSVA